MKKRLIGALLLLVFLMGCGISEDVDSSIDEPKKEELIEPEVAQPKALTQVVDLDLKPLTSFVRAGEPYSVSTRMTSRGTDSNFQVKLSHIITEKNTGDILLTKQETLGLEVISSKRTQFLIPRDTKAGRYVLETKATYESGSASASFEFDIDKAVRVIPPKPATQKPKPKEYEHVQKINITGLGYEPREVVIKQGMWVEWTNIDVNSHTATGAGFDAILRAGETFMYQFNETRNYVYTDTFSGIHPGTITVEK